MLLEIDLQHGLGIATILSGIITFILGYCAAYFATAKIPIMTPIPNGIKIPIL